MKRQALASLASLLFLGCAAPAATVPAPTPVYGALDARATPLPVTKTSTRDPVERSPSAAPLAPENPKESVPAASAPPAAPAEGTASKEAAAPRATPASAAPAPVAPTSVPQSEPAKSEEPSAKK